MSIDLKSLAEWGRTEQDTSLYLGQLSLGLP